MCKKLNGLKGIRKEYKNRNLKEEVLNGNLKVIAANMNESHSLQDHFKEAGKSYIQGKNYAFVEGFMNIYGVSMASPEHFDIWTNYKMDVVINFQDAFIEEVQDVLEELEELDSVEEDKIKLAANNLGLGILCFSTICPDVSPEDIKILDIISTENNIQLNCIINNKERTVNFDIVTYLKLMEKLLEYIKLQDNGNILNLKNIKSAISYNRLSKNIIKKEEPKKIENVVNRDLKLGLCIIGIDNTFNKYQPVDIQIISSNRKLNTNEVEISWFIGPVENIGKEEYRQNLKSTTYNQDTFKLMVHELCGLLEMDCQYKNIGDGEILYNRLDKHSTLDIKQMLVKMRKSQRDKEKQKLLESPNSKKVLKIVHDIDKKLDKTIRVDTFGGINRSTCHYMKYILKGETDDISIRFFYEFGDRREYEGKFVIKDHRTKNYVILDTPVAMEILKANVLQDQYRVMSFPDRNKYIKVIVEGYYKDGKIIDVSQKFERIISNNQEKNTSLNASPKMRPRK